MNCPQPAPSAWVLATSKTQEEIVKEAKLARDYRADWDTFQQVNRVATNAIYITKETRIRLSSWNSLAGVTLLRMICRMTLRNGDVVEVPFEHVPLATRAINTTTHRLGEGWLTSVEVFVETGTPRRGETYVRVQLFNAKDSLQARDLIAHYVDSSYNPTWPDSPLESSVEGPGAIRSITGTDPAANTEISETVPANARWRPLSIRLTLVTDANPGTRQVHLIYDDGTTILLDQTASNTQITGLTRNYNSNRVGLAPIAADNEIYIPIPIEYILSAGFRIRTTTTTIQVGDNYGAPQLLVEEWIEE